MHLQTDDGMLCSCLQDCEAVATVIRLTLLIMFWYQSYSWQHMHPCCMMHDKALGTMTNVLVLSLAQHV